MVSKVVIGTIGKNGNVWLNWLDLDTGERGAGWFSLDTLCRLGYGKLHIDEGLVVNVRTVELGSAPG